MAGERLPGAGMGHWRHTPVVTVLVIVTLVAFGGASAFAISRLPMAIATPLLAYLTIAAGIVLLIGRIATARVHRDAQRLVAAADAAAAHSAHCELTARKTEERFQMTARATNDVLWDWDIRTGNLWWSEGVRTVFGYAHPPSSADEWKHLIHPDDREWVGHSLRGFLESRDEKWSGEYRFRRGDGTFAWVLDRGIVVRDGNGTAVRMLGSMIDLTDRKEAERMKTDFVSFVSHQLRTPLAGMNWMLELAGDTHGLPPNTREYIQEARQSAGRLVAVVNDLLDIARLESGRTMMAREPLQLDEMTRSVLREMQTLIQEKRHAVAIDADRAPPAVGDPQMIRQVIANLLSNAVKYTPDGGHIDVRLRRQDHQVQWLVSDNGMGIPRGAQPRLFEKFFRADNAVARDAEGTGLGLHLVRLVIEHAGGRVWCESEEGRGATFAFTLPVAQQGEES